MRTSIRIRAVLKHFAKFAVAVAATMVAVVAMLPFAKPALANAPTRALEAIVSLPGGAAPPDAEQQIIIGTPAPLITVRRTTEDPAAPAENAAETHTTEATATPTSAPTGDGRPPALGPTATSTPSPPPTIQAISTADARASQAANGFVPVGYGRAGQIWSNMRPGYYEQTVFPVQGISTYYNPGIMEQVLEYRFKSKDITDCPECIGYIALVRAGDINRRVWMQMDDGTVEGPYLVADCAGRNHVARLLRIGWGVDVDWQTAQRWEMKMRNVTLLDAPPEEWAQTIATIGEQREALAAATATPAAVAQAAPAATTTPQPTRAIEELPVHPAERGPEDGLPEEAPTLTPAPQALVP